MEDILSWALPLVVAAILSFMVRKRWISDSVSQALEVGVMTAWNSYGKGRKKELYETGDNLGKFTEEDAEKLRNIAKSTASSFLKSQGIDLDKVISSEALQDLKIKQIVDKFKSSAT